MVIHWSYANNLLEVITRAEMGAQIENINEFVEAIEEGELIPYARRFASFWSSLIATGDPRLIYVASKMDSFQDNENLFKIMEKAS